MIPDRYEREYVLIWTLHANTLFNHDFLNEWVGAIINGEIIDARSQVAYAYFKNDWPLWIEIHPKPVQVIKQPAAPFSVKHDNEPAVAGIGVNIEWENVLRMVAAPCTGQPEWW